MSKEVMSGLNFLTDEAVIRKQEEVMTPGFFKVRTNELILTNKAILYVKKLPFGKIKEVERHPLSDVRVVNGEVQARLGKPSNVSVSLDVYFTYGQESWEMIWEKDVKSWIAEITGVITGVHVEKKDDEFAWVGDVMANMGAVTEGLDSLAGGLNNVRRAMGMKSTEEASCKCSACGASINGTRGESVQCPYCGTYNTL